ncbi:hypothetical protein ACN2AU_09225 [Aerococcus viridans]
MDRTMYGMPTTRKRPYSFLEDVIFKNKYVFISLIMSIGIVIYAIHNMGLLDSVTAVENFTYDQSRIIYITFFIITMTLASAGIVGGITFFFSGKIKSISIITFPIYFVIGVVFGMLKLFRDLIRLPFCLIIWISTKVSDKQYEKHMIIERYEDYL